MFSGIPGNLLCINKCGGTVFEYRSVLQTNNPVNYSVLTTVVTGIWSVAPAAADNLRAAIFAVVLQVINRCSLIYCPFFRLFA
jgi:hypothetical protein